MPRTLEQAFVEFHAHLQPRASETKLTRGHRASIRACLLRNFDLKCFSACGSWDNGTSIAGHSDADYLAHLPAAKMASDSQMMLREVRASLGRAFPRTTGIVTNSPAVRVPFGARACQTTEVVPAKKCGQTPTGYAIYHIADGKGGWKKTSPHAHNAWIRAHDLTLHKRLKPFICFLKAWKYFNAVPISSFYLEMSAARYLRNKKHIVYERDLAGFFADLQKRLSAVIDPTGVAGRIAPCESAAKTRITISKINTAATRAAKAFDATKRGNAREVTRLYRLLFNDSFPACGN